MIKIALNILLMTLLSSCGLISPSDEKKDESAANESDVNNDDQKNSGAALTQSVETVVKFDFNKTFDFVLLRENSDRLTETNPNNNSTYRYEPFIARLYEGEETVTPQLYDLLLGKMYAGNLDIKMGVLDAMHQTETAETLGSLVADENGENVTFDFTKPQSSLGAKERMNHRTSTTYNSPNNFFPLTSLYRFLEKAKLENSAENTSGKFFRKNSKLVILYSQFMDDANDSFNSLTLAKMLDDSVGKGNWKLSIAGIPDEGCFWKLDEDSGTEIEKHTDADASAANISDGNIETNKDALLAYVRRDNMKNLMNYSSGVFMSLCDGDVSKFTEDFLNNAMRPTYFTIDLGQEADFESIKILLGKEEIQDFIYDSKKNQVSVRSDMLKEGQKITVNFINAKDAGKTHTKDSGDGDGVSDIGEKILTPAELAFVNDGIKDALVASCNGCHGNRYNSFDYTYANKNAAFMRITNADNPMPPNDPEFMNSEDGKAIIEWINAF